MRETISVQLGLLLSCFYPLCLHIVKCSSWKGEFFFLSIFKEVPTPCSTEIGCYNSSFPNTIRERIMIVHSLCLSFHLGFATCS